MFGVARSVPPSLPSEGRAPLLAVPLPQAPSSHRRPRAGWWGPRLTDSPPCPPLEEAGCTGRQCRRPCRTQGDPRPSFH